jgi:hypothetical protein
MGRTKKYKTEKERKAARIASSIKWTKKNPEKTKAYRKKDREKDREKYNQYFRNYRAKYKDLINERKRSQKYKNTRSIYRKKRFKEDLDFKLSERLRSALSSIMKSNKIPKKSKALELLGVKIKYFRKYLEHRFAPEMTWENHGKVWHLDHIIPVSAIDLYKDENLKFAFHYRNFQPMFAKDNLQKHNNIFIPVEPYIKLREVDAIVKNTLKRLKPDLDIDLDIIDGGILIRVLKSKSLKHR